MNVVDSSGWLSYFAGDANAAQFAPIIQAADKLVVPTICVYEVFKRIFAQRGEEAALQAVGIMSLGIYLLPISPQGRKSKIHSKLNTSNEEKWKRV